VILLGIQVLGVKSYGHCQRESVAILRPRGRVRACLIYFSFIKGVANSSEDLKILVHCNAGISRSASFVIAYYIREHQMDFQKAFNLVKIKREQIFPNTGFID
jgi:predicted protein tyrosine phosphatase